MTQTLTKTIVEAIEPGEKDIFAWDGSLRGFGVKVTPKGRRVYLVQYRPKGSGSEFRPTRRYTIGPHGRPWTIEAARKAAREVLAKVSLGQDPFLTNREERDREQAELLAKRKAEADAAEAKKRAQREAFSVLVEEFIERHAKVRNRSHSESRRILTSADVEPFRLKPVFTITRADIRDAVGAASDISRGRGRLLFAHLRKFFNWCVENAYLEVSPCVGQKGPPNYKARDRWLSDQELRLVWHACAKVTEPFGDLVRLLILTGQRREEVTAMAWDELDFDRNEWIIPRERSKNDKAHAVDLAPEAVAILMGLLAKARVRQRLENISLRDGSVPMPIGPVFTTTGTTPVSGHSKIKLRIDELVESARQKGADALGLDKPSPIPDWRLHDLRRTAATGMARLGHPPHVIEAVLNHQSGVRGGLVAVYQHYDHRKERRDALSAWAAHVLNVTSDQGASAAA